MNPRSRVASLRAVLFVVGVLAAGTAGFLFFTAGPEGPPEYAAVVGAAGAVSFLAALVLSFVNTPPVLKTVVVPAPREPTRPYDPTYGEVVDIKRTEMHWRTGASGTTENALQAKLDDLDEQMQALKVKLGLGQISNESFTRMMEELHEAKVTLEMSILKSGRKPEKKRH